METPPEPAVPLDPADPEKAVAEAAARCSNWGRWGADDALGTVNFIDEAGRAAAARLVRRGASFSLAQRFQADGPQKGRRRRTNPVHTMLDTGLDAVHGDQGFPHGFGGADDVIAMPLQCSTQWDGLGHIFDHGRAWNGRDAARASPPRRSPRPALAPAPGRCPDPALNPATERGSGTSALDGGGGVPGARRPAWFSGW